MTEARVADDDGVIRRRAAGVLAHVTSLPSAAWPGTLGASAEQFLAWLAACGFSFWQVLPLGVPHGNDSPYQCQSVHAANPVLIDRHGLLRAGWLDDAERPDWLAVAATNFDSMATAPERQEFDRFEYEHSYWLSDFAEYRALKRHFNGMPWWEWPAGLRGRVAADLAAFREHHESALRAEVIAQFLFQRQWQTLRQTAREFGISLFGDMPIFVAHDSADVWAHPELFKLDDALHLQVVAGVPPDAFSSTGQRWGNPHYRWDRMADDGFRWWKDRLRTELSRFDLLRVDHFRGFEAAWEIPASEHTGERGAWQPAPGEALFEALQLEFGSLPLVAEDLGIITDEVRSLRDRFAFPGMKVLQFAFDSDAKNPYLPHNHSVDSVVYTGTHDNDTTLGWFATLSPGPKSHARDYLQFEHDAVLPAMRRAALQSVSRLCIVPLQDLLDLDASHRMNTPGTEQGNWRWQFGWHQVPDTLAAETRAKLALYDRLPGGGPL